MRYKALMRHRMDQQGPRRKTCVMSQLLRKDFGGSHTLGLKGCVGVSQRKSGGREL